MASNTAQTFMKTLQEIEGSRNVEPLVQLFDPNAELGSPPRSIVRHGVEGARQFWREYLSAFDQVHSEFTNVVEGDRFAILEWKSDGKLPSGQPISYNGVSILEIDNDRVSRFRTYYDSAAFLPGGAKRSEQAVHPA